MGLDNKMKRRFLADADLPNIAFHSGPLLNGRKDYEHLESAQRKKLLSAFAALVRYLPIKYKTFVYRRREFDSPKKLGERMKRDVEGMLKDDLAYFHHAAGAYQREGPKPGCRR